MTRLRLQRTHPDAVIPTYAHDGDAGLDLTSVEEVVLPSLTRRAVSTGWNIAIEPGWVGLIHPRSGLALKSGLTVANTPGTIDSSYRGELKVILVNLSSSSTVTVMPGDRIAQLVLQEYGRAEVVVVDEFADSTMRGGKGFGSTGVA